MPTCSSTRRLCTLRPRSRSRACRRLSCGWCACGLGSRLLTGRRVMAAVIDVLTWLTRGRITRRLGPAGIMTLATFRVANLSYSMRPDKAIRVREEQAFQCKARWADACAGVAVRATVHGGRGCAEDSAADSTTHQSLTLLARVSDICVNTKREKSSEHCTFTYCVTGSKCGEMPGLFGLH
jgi:hypothetical protein